MPGIKPRYATCKHPTCCIIMQALSRNSWSALLDSPLPGYAQDRAVCRMCQELPPPWPSGILFLVIFLAFVLDLKKIFEELFSSHPSSHGAHPRAVGATGVWFIGDLCPPCEDNMFPDLSNPQAECGWG